MWIIVAAAICLLCSIFSYLGFIIIQERKTPLNKLAFQIAFHLDLDRAMPVAGNRHSRRSASAQADLVPLGPARIQPEIRRKMERTQLGIEVTNNAAFPISTILVSAETNVDGKLPPRSKYPRAATTIHPYAKSRIMDTVITMDSAPCKNAHGDIDLLVKYGFPGKEHYEMIIKESVDILMEESGAVTHIYFNPTAIPAEVRSIAEP